MSTVRKNSETVKVMAGGIPFIAAGAVWFVLAMILPIYKMSMLIIAAVAAAGVFAALTAVRASQISKLPPAPAVKVRAEELARKLDACRDRLKVMADEINDGQTGAMVTSITDTMDRIADEVERDPKDRNKVRKLANHYTGMITELVEKYVQLEKHLSADAAGENIAGAAQKIRESLADTDESLKKILDNMFSDDAMAVSADIAVLEQMLNTEEWQFKGGL